jgi:hypothetical protein
MIQQLFVNLAVKDVKRTQAFFTELGFQFNLEYSNDNGLCMILNDSTYVMLLKEEFFQSFTHKPVSDAHASTEVLISPALETREAVDALVDKAVSLGAKEYNPPKDHGFMYFRVFEDLDGHQWEWSWLNMNFNPEN